MNNDIKLLVERIIERSYKEAKEEYESLPQSEKTGDAFMCSAIVHAEAELKYGQLGKKLAIKIARHNEQRFDEAHQPDPDLTNEK